MSAYKSYPALQLTSGEQVLPAPMFLHNDNAAAVNFTIKPSPPNELLSPLATTANLLPALMNPLPALSQTTITAQEVDLTGTTGRAAKVAITAASGVITVAAVPAGDEGNSFAPGDIASGIIRDEGGTGVFAGFDTASVTGTPVEDSVLNTYIPTGGTGSGLRIIFNVSALAAIQNVSYVNVGVGYEAGDVLTIKQAKQDLTWTLVDTDIGGLVPVRFLLTADLVANSTFPFTLNAGATSPMRCAAFTVKGTTNRSILGMTVKDV